MFNGKQIIQDTIDWLKIKANSITSIFIKESIEYPNYVLGSERYEMKVTHYEVNSNVLTVTFKQAVNITGTNFLVKSTTLGINNFTLLATVNEVFPVYKNVYKQSFSFTYPDTSLTEISDFEFISFGEYLNSLTVTSVERQADNNIYITFNNPHLVCDSTILGSNSIEIDCPEIGLVMSSLITYTPTSVNANQFRIAKSGSVVAPFVPTYIRFYTGSTNSVLEKTRNGSQIIDNQLERFAFTNSTSRGFYMNNYINWKNGTRSARSITSVLNHIPDETGEFISSLTTNMSNFQSEGVNLIPNRPRLLSTTNYSSFASSSNGNVAPSDISFSSFDSAYIPKVLNVLRHSTVQKSSNTVTIICTSNHFLSVGDSVTVVSAIAGISGTVIILTASLATFTYTLAGADVTAQADINGYNYRTGTSSITTVERTANIATITTATAHGIVVGSWINVTSPILGLTNISYIAQNVTATTIQFKMTGSNIALTSENGASINTSTKYTTRNLLKSRDLRTFGWYIAGTEPVNTTTDLYFYDRNNVGFFANMPAPTSTLGSWNFFVPLDNSARSKFGRYNYFGNLIPTIAYPTDVNIVCEGAIMFGNTTTGTPTDGTLSKISNGDANYFSNGNWRGLLHVLGGTGVNANIVTNTANALLKFVGTGLQAISSLLVDTGTALSYSGTGGFSLTGANATLSSPRALLESNLAVNGIIAELINLQSGTQALVTTALNTASNYHNNSLSATGNTTFGKVIKVTIIGGTFGGAGNTAISITVLGRTITLPTIANNVRFTCAVIFNQLGANISANGLITAEGVNGGTVTTVANAAFVNGNCSISITGGNSIAISRLTIEQINR